MWFQNSSDSCGRGLRLSVFIDGFREYQPLLSLGNGIIDFMEFLHLMDKRMKGIDTEEEIRDMFKVFDVDGNGFISSEEFKWTMMNLGQQLTEEEVEEILRAADLNGDGQIDLEGNKPQK